MQIVVNGCAKENSMIDVQQILYYRDVVIKSLEYSVRTWFVTPTDKWPVIIGHLSVGIRHHMCTDTFWQPLCK